MTPGGALCLLICTFIVHYLHFENKAVLVLVGVTTAPHGVLMNDFETFDYFRR